MRNEVEAGAVNPGAGYSLLRDSGAQKCTEVPAVNKYSILTRVAVAGLALALGTLPGCHDDSNPNLPSIVPVPNSIVVAEINGVKDLLVATTADEGNALNPGYANVILNTLGSLGTFKTGVHYSTTGSNPSSIAVADLTGSGSLDLVIANFGSGSVSVFLHGPTPGTFNPAVDVSTTGQPNQVVISDLNGDGKPDLVLADMSANGNVIVLMADPATPGAFQAPTPTVEKLAPWDPRSCTPSGGEGT